MPQSFSIRRFRQDDVTDVWDVHEASLRASPLAFVEETAVDEDVTAIEEYYLDAGGEFLVGELDADSDDRTAPGVVAIGGYLPVDEDAVEIKRVRVDPDHQRRGYASRLLDELEERAREDECATAVLETVEPLRAAQAFYEAVGYEVVEESVDDVTGVARYRYRTVL